MVMDDPRNKTAQNDAVFESDETLRIWHTKREKEGLLASLSGSLRKA